jgi:LysM repeat protein
MQQWKRLFFYLALNVLISACTVVAVLFIWDQIYGPLPRGLLPRAFNSLRRPTATAVLSAQDTPILQSTPTEAYLVYQVEPGDTFESIAANHNMSVEELIAANGFTHSQPLGAGEILRIPVHPRGSVIIDSVIGAGDLDSERVLLKHRGEGELSLVGWRLEDSKGDVFIFPQFPQLTLFSGGAVNVHTKTGENTVVDLYWGLDHPVWESGATVSLKDVQGNVRSTYTVP